MATPSPTKRKLSDLKATILAPALTSHFECHFNPPPAVNSWLSQKQGSGSGVTYVGNESFFTLSCSEANLPGSQLATHEILNDFHGVTEKHAYRRQFDDRADFTFYVDREYNVIHLFENWISFIGNERRTSSLDIGPRIDDPNASYRFSFPKEYQTEIFIKKFEKDYKKSNRKTLQYKFMKAFPLSISQMPVSYASSELLKCTVSFAYSRYVVN
tara:strand:+ start:330 stop:971 length:642 start_codon:yes stop_codon:yes gene_type:complete